MEKRMLISFLLIVAPIVIFMWLWKPASENTIGATVAAAVGTILVSLWLFLGRRK